MKLFSEHDSRLLALEKKVGLFVLIGVGLLLLLFAVIAVEQGIFASTTPVKFHTDDASKLHQGMEVRLSGFKVGKVVSVVLMDDGVIEVNISINNEYLKHIRHGAKLRLVEQGLLGDGILEVVPGDRDNSPLVINELLPFERQLGMDALAHDLVDRLRPILDNVSVTTKALNDPDGLLHHAKTLSIQVEKASVTATELMKQTQAAINSSNVKINHALDKADALMVKTDGVLTNIEKITGEAGKLTAAASEDLLPMIRDGRVAAEDARNIISSSKEVWPIRNFIEVGGEGVLPMDSYGVQHAQPK